MVLFRLLYIFSILLIPQLLFGARQQEIAQAVLNKLYQVHGHFNKSRPTIELVNHKKNVAVYVKSKNTIQLEASAYKLCTTFGKDSLDALSFIIAHELVHALQASNDLPKTSFIAYDKAFKGSLQMERDADIQGVFISYLAGYRSIQILPDLIDKMYVTYEINDKIIKAYPSKQERKLSANTVVRQVSDLIELFELANRLSQISEHQTAIQCLEYIARYYQGKEIFNNLGVNFVLLGMNTGKLQGELLVFPFELDWNLRIKKPKMGRGDDYLYPIDLLIQQKYYKKAKDYFEITLRLDPKYQWADLNLFTIEVLMNNLELAKQFYEKHLRTLSNMSAESELLQKIKLTYAILLYKMGEIEEAKSMWIAISKDRNQQLADQALCNLNIVSSGKSTYQKPSFVDCNILNIKKADIPESDIKLTKAVTNFWIALDSLVQIEKAILPQSIIYSFVENEEKLFHFQKIKISTKVNFGNNYIPSSTLGNNEKIYKCLKDGIAYIVNGDGFLNYMIRYQSLSDEMP